MTCSKLFCSFYKGTMMWKYDVTALFIAGIHEMTSILYQRRHLIYLHINTAVLMHITMTSLCMPQPCRGVWVS